MMSMRYDNFLANLLFGLTLLTAFMSLAHTLGDWIAPKLKRMPRMAGRTRTTILTVCAFSALLLFLFRLSGPDPGQAFGIRESIVELKLVRSGASSVQAAAEATAPDSRHSWTLYNRFSSETLAEDRNFRALLSLAPPVTSLIGTSSTLPCKAWNNRAIALGLKVRQANALPPAKDRGLVLVCASEPLSSERLESLRAYVTEGGSVFFVGAIADGIETNSLSQLLQVRSWRRAPRQTNLSVTLGGALFSWGEMPSGFRLGLGPDWSEQPGRILAETTADARIDDGFRANEQVSLTPLITRTFIKGRVAWTSLPANLSRRLEALYGPYWDLMSARIFAHLSRLPMMGLEAVPTTASPLVIPVVHAQYQFKNASAISDLLSSLQAPSSFYLVMSEALQNVGTVERVHRAKHEIGASEFNHEGSFDKTFYEQVARYVNWRKSSESLLANDATARADAISSGTLLNAGSRAATYAAVLANRFSFVVGDPFADWITPYRLALDKTGELRERIESRRTTNRDEFTHGDVSILPIFIEPDFQYFREGKMEGQGTVTSKLLAELARARWMGGPLTVPIHTQVLGSADGRDRLKTALEAMKAEGAHFMRAVDYIEWWNKRTSLQLNFRATPPNRVFVQLANIGTTAATDVALNLSMDSTWAFSGLPSELTETAGAQEGLKRLQMKELKPGQVLEWEVVRQTEKRP